VYPVTVVLLVVVVVVVQSLEWNYRCRHRTRLLRLLQGQSE